MYIPSLQNKTFTPGAINAVFPALVSSVAQYLFHMKYTSRTGVPGKRTHVNHLHIPLLILSLLPAILFLFPETVRAEEVGISGIVYEINGKEKTASVVRPETEYIEQADIPETVTYEGQKYRVTAIEDNAFENCIYLRTVTIPSGVTSIGEYAFYDCVSLESMIIPSSVTSVGDNAFGMCQTLMYVTIQRDTEAISLGENVFIESGFLEEVKIEFPEGSEFTFDITEGAGFVNNGDKLFFENDDHSTEPAVLTPYFDNSITEGPGQTTGHRGFFRLCAGCRLPETGFSSLSPSALSEQPASLRYTPAGLRLMIPSLDVDSELVTVPLNGDTWPVEWLGDRSGILDGSALPGNGFSMIAAHNTLNDTEFGPFAMLSLLETDDLIAVSGKQNDLKVFRVFANELLAPDDMKTVASIASREADTLILITCENESAEGGYLNRRVVFAKP